MKKKFLYGLSAVVTIFIIAFAYYAISPLFRNTRLDEVSPMAQQTEGTEVIRAQVVGTFGHPASGTAHIVEAEGKRYIRYENLKTINGPDLFVYLAKDLEAKEYVSLGTLRATEGNVNYEIPPGVDLVEYRYVMTWCKQFGVLFNYADISKM